MKIFGIHIISDERLKEKIDLAKTEQRELSNAVVATLLHNSEVQQRQLESIRKGLIRAGVT